MFASQQHVDREQTEYSQSSLTLLPPGRSSIIGTVARIKVIYCHRELKLFKMTGVISHICFRAGKGVHSAPVN